MRNPERIEKMLNKIGVIWEAYPDLRFGQLVHFIFKSFDSGPSIDIFHIEDNTLNDVLDNLCQDILEG